ncbi:MAG TPA: PilZ domain-containing protein [Candidatus Omnitrophota bacterium]|nr:PilZ domain-containing protein [Candidatus Omnitrophota bacterium]HPS19806.1 PilZ domain-containing protein [Candidatus Omnitrophota bacterium]
MEEDRRKTKRYAIAYPIENSRESSLNLVDVSPFGVGFKYPGFIEKDQNFNLKIFLKKKMFIVNAVVVYSNPISAGEFSIGAKFENTPEGFIENLEREIEDIEHYRRECSRYYNKNFTFKEASFAYLRNKLPSEII